MNANLASSKLVGGEVVNLSVLAVDSLTACENAEVSLVSRNFDLQIYIWYLLTNLKACLHHLERYPIA